MSPNRYEQDNRNRRQVEEAKKLRNTMITMMVVALPVAVLLAAMRLWLVFTLFIIAEVGLVAYTVMKFKKDMQQSDE